MNLTHIKRKLTTRPIWWLETKKSYPIRDEIFKKSAIHTGDPEKDGLVIATVPSTIPDAAWTAISLLRYFPKGTSLEFVSPSFPEESRQSLSSLFPNAKLTTDDDVDQRCDDSEFRNVKKLASYHPMGNKLLTILDLQRRKSFVYADADILAFEEPTELVRNAINHYEKPYFIQDIILPGEPITQGIATKMGLTCHPRFSCGLMSILRNSLDINLANALLDTEEKITRWFPDTIVLAMLMERANATALPADTYVQDTRRQFYHDTDHDYSTLKVRHFVGPVRHLMYKFGMPIIRKQTASTF